jgi:hypothetical protein
MEYRGDLGVISHDNHFARNVGFERILALGQTRILGEQCFCWQNKA